MTLIVIIILLALVAPSLLALGIWVMARIVWAILFGVLLCAVILTGTIIL